SPASRSNGESAFKEGELLIKLRSDALVEALVQGRGDRLRAPASPVLDAVLARFGAKSARRMFVGASGALGRVLHLEARGDAQAFGAALRLLPEVEYAETNQISTGNAAPNDTYYASSGAWGQPYRDQWGLEKIRAEAAWETTRGSGVLVAVVDTGLDYAHP